MTDALMRNLDALRMCILGIDIEDENTLERIKSKKKKGVDIEEQKVYPDIDTALKVATAKAPSAVTDKKSNGMVKIYDLTDLETGEKFKFTNLTEISKYVGCSIANVSYFIRNERLVKGRYKVVKSYK